MLLPELLSSPFKEFEHLVPDLDALPGEVGQVAVPVLLLVHRRRHDDNVVGTDPGPGYRNRSLTDLTWLSDLKTTIDPVNFI